MSRARGGGEREQARSSPSYKACASPQRRRNEHLETGNQPHKPVGRTVAHRGLDRLGIDVWTSLGTGSDGSAREVAPLAH